MNIVFAIAFFGQKWPMIMCLEFAIIGAMIFTEQTDGYFSEMC